ncbi:hypothetical protein CPY51_09090 [Rhizobium tubonense]|uniref:Uncharacterized protein n=1 Tax=Rhizobium tubonense TaxID=484088 RepID=A0A2W4CQ34_9HYPH|nr:hypothetical protein CPY51_09090 [Rhizobium tubonense]
MDGSYLAILLGATTLIRWMGAGVAAVLETDHELRSGEMKGVSEQVSLGTAPGVLSAVAMAVNAAVHGSGLDSKLAYRHELFILVRSRGHSLLFVGPLIGGSRPGCCSGVAISLFCQPCSFFLPKGVGKAPAVGPNTLWGRRGCWRDFL